MTLLSDLARDVKGVTTNAPDFVVERTIVNIAREFFQETEVWNEVSDVLFLAGLDSVEVNTPSGADMLRVVWLTAGDRELEPVGDRQFYTLRESKADPTRFAHTTSGIRVHPTPGRQLNGQVSAVYFPRAVDTDIPDRLMGLYRTILVDGVIANLLMQGAQWGNASKGDYYYSRYLRGLENANRRAFRNQGNVVGVTEYGGY